MTDEQMKTVSTTYEFFLGIADRFGVPCLILAAVLWMIRDAGMAVHQSVVVPVVLSHQKFLEKTEQALERMSESQDKQADTLQALAAGQKELQAAVLKPAGGHN